MSWKDTVCLIIVIMGLLIFLYGANYYSELAGWSGIILVAVGVFVEVALTVYGSVTKKERGQKP